MNRLVQYIKATKAEMRHVSWPTQYQTFIYTLLVIGISIVVALFITVFDQIFITILEFITNRFF